MRETNVKLKNKNGEDVVYEGISTVSLDDDSGGKKVFSLGVMSTGTVDLDFSKGNHLVIAPDDKLFDKVVIYKPLTLVPGNIAQGVIVAGIEGTFEGAKDLPILNTPSISRSSDTITISNPSTNGNFNKSFNVYSNGDVFFNQTGTSFSLIGKFEEEHDYKIEVTCNNPLMTESNKSNSISFAVYSIKKEFGEFITTTDTQTKISNGLKYSIRIKSAFGYWLPELIKVYKKKNNTEDYELTNKYTYSMYTGEITLDSMDANIRIVVEADDEPQLKRVDVELTDEFFYKTNLPRYAEKLFIYDCEELIYEAEKEEDPITYQIQELGTPHTFILGSDGFYQPTGKGVNSSYSMCRIMLVNTGPDSAVNMMWMQSSESGYDYGLVSKMDVALTKDASADSNVILNAVSKSFTTPQTLVLEVPHGTHFYDIKYRKDGSVHSGWDMFEFQIDKKDNVFAIENDQITVEENLMALLRNSDYENRKSANVTHHVYLDELLIIETKEGI